VPTSNGSGTVVLKRSELEDARGQLVRIGGEDVAVFRTNGCVHAIQNTCPHAESPLVHGTVDGHDVICAEHGYRFDLRTGACSTDAQLRLKTYRLVADGPGFTVQE